ncbi:hypothetical protein PEC301296_41230 [Pectobacterium carotovorum subsp. carotovorum]|nr:hypothetical protein GZ59_33980 [Pectobacterium atrosepticum]KMK82329.1 hypothetical protein KCQ_07420 [Pectobacterium atrosepticum ICMP 1526]POW24062.1 hypothetical protein PB72LOC_04249 [Pectobacterium atrosepticum]GKV87812.1 hypothetical protein PEC301296_41230 [Pectobacterium carotovorum subsp. carotovorum]
MHERAEKNIGLNWQGREQCRCSAKKHGREGVVKKMVRLRELSD